MLQEGDHVYSVYTHSRVPLGFLLSPFVSLGSVRSSFNPRSRMLVVSETFSLLLSLLSLSYIMNWVYVLKFKTKII